MTSTGELLRELGVEVLSEEINGRTEHQLRRAVDNAELQVESDPDGSLRIRLTEGHDQCIQTPERELVVIRHAFENDGHDVGERTVRARSTRKAAGELTKLRAWDAVSVGLMEAAAIGKSGEPNTLDEWRPQNQEEADMLQRQVTTIGLSAEKTHQFSAQIFEPALLATFRQRETPLRKGVALYFTAEAQRRRINEEARKRIIGKTANPAERRQNSARVELLGTRVAELYRGAAKMFDQARAGFLQSESEAKADAFSDSPETSAPTSPAVHVQMAPLLDALSASSEYEETRKLIGSEDNTLRNTVIAINRLSDTKQQRGLEWHLATQLVDTAKRLRTLGEVFMLLKKIHALKGLVTEETYISRQHIERYKSLVIKRRPNVLKLVEQKGEGS